MENHKIEGKRIIGGNGTIEFDYPIKEVVAYNENLDIVILETSNDIYNQNVFAISDGKLVWQIEKCKELDSIGMCPFIEIRKKDLSLHLYNWCGYSFNIDPLNGHIIDYQFTK